MSRLENIFVFEDEGDAIEDIEEEGDVNSIPLFPSFSNQQFDDYDENDGSYYFNNRNEEYDRNEDEVAFINEMTSIYLDTKLNPIGSLSNNVLDHAHYLMDKWAKCDMGEVGAKTCERILYRMIEEHHFFADTLAERFMTNKLYTIAIDAWARSNSPKKASQRALSILKQLYHDHSTFGDSYLTKPFTITYNAVINTLSKSGHAAEAQELLDFMIEYEGGGEVVPNIISYNGVLDAWARTGDCESASKAEELLMKMRSSSSQIKPDEISYNTVIESYSKIGRPEKAVEIMELMKTDGYAPDNFSYASIISAWARSDEPDETVSQKALDIFQDMMESEEFMDVRTCNAFLDCFAKHGNVEQAELLLNKMESDDEKLAEPSTVSYNAVMNAIITSDKTESHSEAAKKAHTLLLKMNSSDKDNIEPDVFTYSTVIKAYANSGDAKKADELLEEMAILSQKNPSLRPNTVTVNSVISAHAKSNEEGCAERAERILARLEKMYCDSSEDLKPTTVSYTSVIDCYSRDPIYYNSGANKIGVNLQAEKAYQKARIVFDKMEKMALTNPDAKPNVHAYNTFLNVIAKQNSFEAAEMAMQILEKMEQSPEENKPNVVTYTTVMNAIVRSSQENSAAKTREILDRMTGTNTKPNAFSYTIVIDAYAKQRDFQSIMTAQEILEQMEEDYLQRGNLLAKPNTIIYTAVIDAWSKSGFPESGKKAEEVLKRLLRLYKEKKGDPELKPNFLSYNACINAWAKSRTFGKAKKAREILDYMISQYRNEGDITVKPNIFTFTTVMNACAYTIGDQLEKQTALNIAANTYKQIANPEQTEFDRPNHITYATFLKACTNLVPSGDNRDKSMKTVFNKCCQDGQVNELVLKQLKLGLSESQYYEIIESLSPEKKKNESLEKELASLPEEWKQNVKEIERKYRAQSFSRSKRNNKGGRKG
eukprot:CAMPEP_0178949756 /NCGR_PEP_ID=MMETSP0789-20121207/6245_1 /TAXON_ID=3005 /ORGANISM="Rhizosolenia setigera, Strain CCMP 1694" /LENGTH=938 /DNA_ID=CAMNT_0020630349 /DNA_START=310 /DNA_END=3122 /DNA_ORIENTATION=+